MEKTAGTDSEMLRKGADRDMEKNCRRFTAEELEIAKSTDLCDVAASLGYTVKRIGRYHTLEEMDSMRIYGRKSWFRWSRKHDSSGRGGSQIDFLKTFAGLGTREAVFWLLDFAGYREFPECGKKMQLKHRAEDAQAAKKKEFVLPALAYDNSCLYSYLVHERMLSREVADYFVKRGLIYEAAGYHNIVFKGNDKDGITRFAFMRGISDRDGKSFKCDVAGSDKNYGFNLYREGSSRAAVFEAAIDAMSYVDIFQDYSSSLLALGMLSDAPLATFLSEHPQVQKIRFCLDNDGPGRRASAALIQKYYRLGYETEDRPPPDGCKDYNQWLQEIKKPVHAAREAGREEKRKPERCL